MENSTRHHSSASLDAQDPFRDPISSAESSISAHDSSSDRSDEIRIHPPTELIPAHIRDPIASNSRRQQQQRYVPTHSQDLTDVILSIPPIGRPGEDVHYDLPQREKLELQYPQDTDSSPTLPELVTRRAIPEPLDRTPRKIKVGKRLILATKWIFVSFLVSAK
jgi:hypothetical protein